MSRESPPTEPDRRRAPESLAAAGWAALLGFLASSLASSLVASRAAAEFRGDATTVLRAYDLISDIEGVEKVREFRPIDQYLHLTWDELGRRRAWTVDLDLRGRFDPAATSTGEQEDVQVLLALARWRSKAGLGLSIGRQRSVIGLGWRAFDGLRLDFDQLRRASFFVQAGLPVAWAENEAPSDGFTWAAGGSLVFPRHGSLGVDYELRRMGGLTQAETLGLDLELGRGRFRFAGNADYSLRDSRFGETALSLRQRLRGPHVLEASVTRVEQLFPPDSIFAVFTSNPYTETRLSWERRAGRFPAASKSTAASPSGSGSGSGSGAYHGLAFGLFVAWEDYVDTGLAGPEDIQRAAATLRFEGPRRARHRAELGWQEGFSGDRLAARYDVDLDVAPRLRLGGGASLNRYENFARLDDADEELALRARLAYERDGRWDLALSVEQYLGRDRDTLRGQLVFHVKLGAARRERPWWGGYWREGWAPSRPPASQKDGAAEAADTADTADTADDENDENDEAPR